MGIITRIRNILFLGFWSSIIVESRGFKKRDEPMKLFNLVRLNRDVGIDGIKGFGEGHASPSTPTLPSPKTAVYQLELPEDYNMHDLPKHASGRPMEIFVQLNIRKILDFDEKLESVKIDLEFRVFWTDYSIRDYFNAKRKGRGLKKISYDELTPEQRKNMTKTLNDPQMLESIWTPNLFFGSLLQVTQPYAMTKPTTLKVMPDIGAFEYLTRLSVVTDCPMHFYYYPADTQECKFSIRSFSYTENDLKLKWYKTGVWLHELETSNFDIKVGKLRDYSKMEDDEDSLSEFFHVFEFRINTRRRLSYHVVQTYLPSTFYIVITCLCFLLPWRFVEARIGIAMTTLLTLTAMFAAVRESTPIVSYVKAIDFWMAGCIMFVFLTLAEFTFITWLRNIKDEYANANGADVENCLEMELDLPFHRVHRKDGATHVSFMGHMKVRTYKKLMYFLEKYNFPIFISILTVYSIMYWAWLLNSADYFQWDVEEQYNNIHGDPW